MIRSGGGWPVRGRVQTCFRDDRVCRVHRWLRLAAARLHLQRHPGFVQVLAAVDQNMVTTNIGETAERMTSIDGLS